MPHSPPSTPPKQQATQPHRQPPNAALLINLGTPDELTIPAVRKFLSQFLSDPLVIRLPRPLRWLNPILGRLIGQFRARHALEMYSAIWTEQGSPLRIILEQQRAALQERLGDAWQVHSAMRYGEPSIPRQLTRIAESGAASLTVIPLYPQYSHGTTGSVLLQIAQWIRRTEPHIRLHVLSSCYDEPAYIAAQAELIAGTVQQFGWTSRDSFLLFSAHSIPLSHVAAGDPYPRQVAASATAIARQLDWPCDRFLVAYQSRFGPTQWLAPSTEDAAEELTQRGEKRIVVCPLSFTTDCLETLEELGVRLAEQVASSGGRLALCPALNDSPTFVEALAGWCRRNEVHATTITATTQPSNTQTES